MARPDTFTLNFSHPLADGLLFAGLGRGAGSMMYIDSSLHGNHGVLDGMDTSDWRYRDELQRWGTFHDQVSVATLIQLDRHMACYGVSFWLEPTGTGIWEMVTGAIDEDNYISIKDNTPQTIRIQDNSSNNSNWSITAPASWPAHYAFSLVNGEWYLYVNGVSQGTDTSGNTYLDVEAIGSGYVGSYKQSYGYNGEIYDPMYWDRPLSAAEIKILSDPSDVMLSGLISPQKRRFFPYKAGGAPPAASTWIWARQQETQVIGGGEL